MRIVMFYHSALSDWNHGNAHFLRGVATELIERGHDVCIYEPSDAWSYRNLIEQHGRAPIEKIRYVYPALSVKRYDPKTPKLDAALDGADMVIVHEWNDHDLVRRIGRHHRHQAGYKLFFHDTHHRSVTDSAGMAAYDLSDYDGVLAFGGVIRDLYISRGWARQAWTWHEAADTRVFRPVPAEQRDGDVVWIGNWGDDERTAEIAEFLLRPVKSLAALASVYGVRYPESALRSLRQAGIGYRGWLPNFEVPHAMARYRLTVHIPRRPYAEALRGIPTIRVFEALACGIPLISAPWDDCEGLFTPGEDFLVARDWREMRRQMRMLLEDEGAARELAARGRQTILDRHTCLHRVDELLSIYSSLGGSE